MSSGNKKTPFQRSRLFRMLRERAGIARAALDPSFLRERKIAKENRDKLNDLVIAAFAATVREGPMDAARMQEKIDDYLKHFFTVRVMTEEQVSETIRNLPQTDSGTINIAEILKGAEEEAALIRHEEPFEGGFTPDELLEDPHGDESPAQFLTSHFGDESADALVMYRECQASPRPGTPPRSTQQAPPGAPDPQRSGTVIGTALTYSP